MRNLKKPESAATEDCDPIWVAVMDTAHNQPPAMSEQLENNDPLRLAAEVKREHIATQHSIRDANRENEPHRTIAREKEKIQIDQIPDDDSIRSLDNEMDKNPCKTSKASHKEESFLCAECGKCFRLKDSYLRHMRIHKDERPFTCHVCGKQFRDSGGLTRHLKDVHAKLKNFMCDLCGKSFASKATREDHRRTHTGERPYVCDSCGKTFKSKASLYIHSKLHTDEFPHACSYCGKRFRRRQEVLAHITTHTGEKNHACDVCAKKFRVKSELARHKLIHSESKPFVCIKCGLAFRQKRYLNNHIKSRHNESLRAS
ncbi:putative zinc finger protein 211 isoform 2 [Lasius niger]|uniref:Putative zinc finger protein 211 isoform 2 n=1 Tax=Lasius niger TaxID=67767 RepID=A0A0J7NW87_LASNI|nr:putative zinc finger protein 211 isoform 2 [Lasius niger]